MIYLDYNAITCGFKEVIDFATNIALQNKFLNPSSLHSAGKVAKTILNNAKNDIVNSLKAKCHDIYFVSGATEGNNMVLNAREFDAIVTLQTEHESVLACLHNKPHIFIKTDTNGIVDLNHLEESLKNLNSANFLCSIMLVNNESGILQDINQISAIVKKYGGIMHSDCSQAIGKIYFDFSIFDLDIITFSGNKMHSGFGGGCVICNSGFDLKPLIFGGGQQNYKRGGTENIMQISSLSQALLKVNAKDYLTRYQNHTSLLQKTIEDVVLKNEGEVFGLSQQRVTNTSLIKMQNVNNFIQMMEFDLNNICISIGSACSSGKTEVSHVLNACGVSNQDAKQYIRVSSGIFNTLEEMQTFCEVWKLLSKR